ncbi:hypothetical protein [Methanosarcina sp.]
MYNINRNDFSTQIIKFCPEKRFLKAEGENPGAYGQMFLSFIEPVRE